jgi:hypothetical protein
MQCMAKKGNRNSRRSNGMKKKNIQPAPMTFYLQSVVPAETIKTDFIDLSQIASLVNRRFYRQGLNWAVAGFKFLTTSGFGGAIACSKLPNTWVMANSWEKSFQAWKDMNDKALDNDESIKPRFFDFKIYADSTHHQAGSAANLLPTSFSAAYTAGDWDYSTIQVPDTATAAVGLPQTVHTFDLIATGGSFPGASPVTTNDAVSLIEGYAASRALPNILDPNTPDDARSITGATPENWMSAIFNEGLVQDSDVVRDLQTQNEIAPYPFENDGVNLDTMYPGGANQGAGLQLHDQEYVTATTIGGTSRLKGGNFPCGLIRIDSQNDLPATGQSEGWVLMIDLIPGDHRGYLCETMTEM